MEEEGFDTIRDTPIGTCIGATIIGITSDDTEEFLSDPDHNNKIYFHLSNGETFFCTVGTEGSGLIGMLGNGEE